MPAGVTASESNSTKGVLVMSLIFAIRLIPNRKPVNGRVSTALLGLTINSVGSLTEAKKHAISRLRIAVATKLTNPNIRKLRLVPCYGAVPQSRLCEAMYCGPICST